MPYFGGRLKTARKMKNIKQADLAEILNVTKSTISNWERDINKPDIDQLSQICDFLGVTADCLIGYNKENFERESMAYFIEKVDKLFDGTDYFGDKKYSDNTGISKVYYDVVRKSLDYGLWNVANDVIFFMFVYISDLFDLVDKTHEQFQNRENSQLKSEYLKLQSAHLPEEARNKMQELIDFCCEHMPQLNKVKEGADNGNGQAADE